MMTAANFRYSATSSEQICTRTLGTDLESACDRPILVRVECDRYSNRPYKTALLVQS
jgi:hypothetical protein